MSNYNNRCRFCISYHTIKTNDSILCLACGKECNTKKTKKTINKLDNKRIHLKNVVNDIAFRFKTPINSNLVREITDIIKQKEIDKEFVSSTFITEFLRKEKNIKSYIQTFLLLNECMNNNMVYNNSIRTQVTYIFDLFINYQHSINYTRTIPYNYILDKIFKSLGISDNMRPMFTKVINKKDDRDKVWNDFILYLSENSCENIKYNIRHDVYKLKNMHAYNEQTPMLQI